jgi:hypothetical protein
VELSFQEALELGSNVQPTWIAAARRASIDDSGKFMLDVPESRAARGPWVLDVLAPNGERLHRQAYEQSLPQEIRLSLEPKDAVTVQRSQDPLLGRRVKATGRVLDAMGKRPAANVQVVLWGAPLDGENGEPRAFATARTGATGYFSFEYPRGRFRSAFGVVGIGGGIHVPIPLAGDAFPRSVILVVTIPEDGIRDDTGDCGCVPSAPRGQDPVDVVTSPESFSSDVGGGRCVDFTVPNRAIEEFRFYTVVRTTEPAIKGLTLSDGYRPIPQEITAVVARMIESRSGTSDRRPPDRRDDVRVSPDALVRVGDTPNGLTRAELGVAADLTTLEGLRHILETLTKPSAGRSVLSAQNPIDWDAEPTFYMAATIAHGHILLFTQTWRADGYSMGDLVYSLPLAPCQKKQIAVLDWERREIAERTEEREAREELSALLTRDRDIAEIVKATLTETLRGASAAATFGLSSIINEGLGVLGLGVAGSGATQDSARSITASSLQQLRDSTLQSASSVRSQRSTVVQTVSQGETVRAQTEVIANHNHCHAITVQYFEVLRHFLVTQELTAVQECLFIPLLMSRFDMAKALRWRTALARFLKDRSLRRGFDALERMRSSWVDSDLPTGRFSEEVLEDLSGELRVSFVIKRPTDLEDGRQDLTAWAPLERFLWDSADSIFNELLFDFAAKERDRIFREKIAPRVAQRFMRDLKFYFVDQDDHQAEVAIDPTLVSEYVSGAPLLTTLRLLAKPPAWTRERITAFKIEAQEELPPGSRATVSSGTMRYRTAHFSHVLFNESRLLNDLLVDDPVRVPTWPDREELRNPRAEDRELGRHLIAHLNEHLEHYHKVIWWTMDPDRRYMLLDGYEAPNAGGRSVASVVENRLIGIVGNCLVMPVAPGNHLDPTYRRDGDNRLDLLDHYAPTEPAPPMRVSVPTRGVFAEAVMGACNSCEEKDDSRFWRFEESPCGDEPTPIQALSTETRRSEPGDLKPQEFPAPIVNLQNAPAAPDPTGLAAALQLLGASNAFRDVTGLAQNQQNALASLAITQDTLRQMISTSAQLQKEKNAQQNLPSAMQTLYQAMKKGVVDEAQARQLAEGFFKSAGAGSASSKPATEQPEVKDLLRRDDLTRVTYHRPPEFLQAEYRGEPQVLPVERELIDPTVDYGGYSLRRGDRDNGRVYEGGSRTADAGDNVPAAGETGYVRQLQEDLYALGFTFVQADGDFGLMTEWAVREFQIAAKMPSIAVEQPITADSPPRYIDRLTKGLNLMPYDGPISGVVNEATRLRIKWWVIARWRCPVVIEAWNVNGPDRAGAAPVAGGENLWLHTDVRDPALRMFARDFSGYYAFPSSREEDDLFAIGDYAVYRQHSGPRAVPPHQTWWEAEILPGTFVGVAMADLTPEQRSTFKVIRAFSEVECYGHYDGVNCYDDAFASFGPCHWTAGNVGWQGGGELGGFFAYLRESDPAAFTRAIEGFGLRAVREWGGDGHALFSGARRYNSRLALQREDGDFAMVPRTDAEMNYFRSWHWFYRYVMAGRTIEGFYRAMWNMARIRIRDVLRTEWGHDAPTVPLPDGSERPVTIGDYCTSERVVAMIIRWHIRAPADMVDDNAAGEYLTDAFADSGVPQDVRDWARGNDETAADHAARLRGYQEALVAGLLGRADARVDSLPEVASWPNHRLGGPNPRGFVLDPDVLDPANPRLSTEHGSFRFDDSGLPPVPA